jgi:hypothetical protein
MRANFSTIFLTYRKCQIKAGSGPEHPALRFWAPPRMGGHWSVGPRHCLLGSFWGSAQVVVVVILFGGSIPWQHSGCCCSWLMPRPLWETTAPTLHGLGCSSKLWMYGQIAIPSQHPGTTANQSSWNYCRPYVPDGRHGLLKVLNKKV